MAVLTKEQYMEQVRNLVGDSADDASLAIIENMFDTYDDMEQRANGDGENWKEKYEKNDKEWREKYKERFFTGKGKEEDEEEEEEEVNVKTSFDELFE